MKPIDAPISLSSLLSPLPILSYTLLESTYTSGDLMGNPYPFLLYSSPTHKSSNKFSSPFPPSIFFIIITTASNRYINTTRIDIGGCWAFIWCGRGYPIPSVMTSTLSTKRQISTSSSAHSSRTLLILSQIGGTCMVISPPYKRSPDPGDTAQYR